MSCTTKLKLRVKRSIDWLGTAWKWLARDMEILDEHMNALLTNNNQRVIINQGMVSKINEIVKKQKEINRK